MARKEKHIHYIYKTTCNVTGRWYIGMHSTSNEEDGYIGSGLRLRRSIRKYGKDNHTKEILEYFDSRELLIEAEKGVITKDMIDDNNCMNLKGGGEGGFISEEQQKHRSSCGGKALANKLKNDEEFAKQHKIKAKETILNNKANGKMLNPSRFKNKIHSEETKRLMSESKKGTGTGENNSQYGTCWITKDGFNKKIKKYNFEEYQLEGWVQGRK